jgi:hypothetical protein
MDKRFVSSEGALDSLKHMFEEMMEPLRRMGRRIVSEPAQYHSIEAKTRAFERGLRAVRRHQRLKQAYPLPRHIQDKLAMR